ncbi:MAG: hypothetical protein ACYTGZ_18440 [Planctomycetota bacterium]|jgi:hypothetical protein
MSTSLFNIAFGLSLLAAGALAQDAAPEEAKKADAAKKPAAKEAVDPAKPAPTGAAKAEKQPRRVLKPGEVAGEMLRIRTKADIKAELKIRTNSGRPVVFAGVVRNGKLVERIIDRRFVPQKDVTHPRCGVRIWWSGNSDGYIFFRYSTIETITLTGQLTAEERREIMRRLKAKREGTEYEAAKKAAAAAEKKLPDLTRLSDKDREMYLLAHFPVKSGWTATRYRELKRKQIIENVELSPNEAVFVKYFRQLEDARFRELRDSTSGKEKFEPGSAESDTESDSGDKPEKDE